MTPAILTVAPKFKRYVNAEKPMDFRRYELGFGALVVYGARDLKAVLWIGSEYTWVERKFAAHLIQCGRRGES